MSNPRWLTLTFATILVVVGVSAAVAYVIDPYGVLRDSRGRSLRVYQNERQVKLLMNRRYVPSNFSGLLIGTSSSANWDLGTISGERVFNESLEGGNAAEGKLLATEAMQNGKFRLAVLVLSHAMIKENTLKDGMDSLTIGGTLGSLYLYRDEVRLVWRHVRSTAVQDQTAPNGQIELFYPKNLTAKQLPADQLMMNAAAVQQYRELAQALQASGAKLVYVVPPMYEPCHQLNQPVYDDNLEKLRTFLPPAPTIDFDDQEFLSFRKDPGNYIDCFHLQVHGAQAVSAILKRRISQL